MAHATSAGEEAPLWALLINVVNLVAAACFLLLFAYTFPRVKLWVKNRLGRLTFSDSLHLTEGSVRKIIPHWHLDAEGECPPKGNI